VSDDGSCSVVVIALLGNPFSPRYARARAAGEALALDHCAMNVAVTTPGRSAWALTERPRTAVRRDATRVCIGSSAMRRAPDGSFVVDVDERTAPWSTPLRGRVRLVPSIEIDTQLALDGRGAHVWHPRVPLGRVEVDLDEPRISFRGTGYLDENAGEEPLEAAFSRWSWSRVASEDRAATIVYDVALRDGRSIVRGLRIDEAGFEPFGGGRTVDLGRTRFGLQRSTRVERDAPCRLRTTLEDGPYYARSIVDTALDGRPASGMHETVCLRRFSSRWVRFLLPFRMRVEAA